MLASRVTLRRVGAVRNAVVTRPVRSSDARRISAFAAEEAVDSAVDNAFVYGEDEPEPATTSKAPEFAAPTYRLNVLYLERCIGLAVDQQLASGEKAPVTEYFMWPAKDAWDLLKTNLEGMPWISATDRIILLNSATQIINFWQDEEVKHTMAEAQAEFPEVQFLGASP